MSNHLSMTTLLIEDEFSIRRFLRAGLSGTGINLIEAANGRDGARMIASHNPDLVLLDLGLPDIDGIQLISEIREWSKVPLIVLSARGQERDKIEALDRGADDYLTKPFQLGELLARIRAVSRRGASGIAEKSRFKTGELEIDLQTRLVLVQGQHVHLTPKEFKLLSLLVRYEGCVLTHKQLLGEVWGQSYQTETHYLRVFMKNLRHKIEKDPARPVYLITEPGIGYRLGGFDRVT